jgi:hypothetical protein
MRCVCAAAPFACFGLYILIFESLGTIGDLIGIHFLFVCEIGILIGWLLVLQIKIKTSFRCRQIRRDGWMTWNRLHADPNLKWLSNLQMCHAVRNSRSLLFLSFIRLFHYWCTITISHPSLTFEKRDTFIKVWEKETGREQMELASQCIFLAW